MNEFDYKEIIFENLVYCEVAESSEVFEGKGIRVRFSDDEDHQIAVLRYQGELFAFHNICPHRHADRFHEGLIDKRNSTLVCPLHGWTYRLSDGQNINALQGTKSLKKFKVFELEGKIFLEKPELIIPKWRNFD